MENKNLSISLQCKLASVSRATHYSQKGLKEPDSEDDLLLKIIDEEYTKTPFYGSRRMRTVLKNKGYCINRKRVQRLMEILGIRGIAPGPDTSKPHPEHKIYPYLLRGVKITKPNQVWSTDITYIRLEHGFVYLVAVMDWYSRKVLSFRISNTMSVGFCVDCLEEALAIYGAPEIFNSDQGSQFTSGAFTKILLDRSIQISMDGRGRAFDNIFVERLWRTLKYEDVYLRGYSNMPELLLGLTSYFSFYNAQRFHQALQNKTPNQVYESGQWGGALIIDKFNETTGVTEEKNQEKITALSNQPELDLYLSN